LPVWSHDGEGDELDEEFLQALIGAAVEFDES
jgi:hypothetical protein